MKRVGLFAAAALCMATQTFASNSAILVEAENFEKHGGWKLDQQFMDIMGSPFLLAHGLGTPVKDAETTVSFKEAGQYNVWVRTRDWVGPWKGADIPDSKKAYGTPGKFQLLLNGKALDTSFGTKGAEWHWQYGGSVDVKEGGNSLGLHDLTGFAGRCDAILFSKNSDITIPNDGDEMAEFRRKLLGHPEVVPDAGEYDLVVVGGGLAGTCAAIKAARLGVKVALIQDRPVVGGNNSSEVRMWSLGRRRTSRAKQLGDISDLFHVDQESFDGNPASTGKLYYDQIRNELVASEENLDLYHSYRMNQVEMDGDLIVAVLAQNIKTGARLRFPAKYFADCTGDGCVGYLAGADYEISVKGQGHMGRSNLWFLEALDQAVEFPRCPWALDLSNKPFPGRDAVKAGKNPNDVLGRWFWESGFHHDPFEKGEYIRDWNFRAMYGTWDALKNVDKVAANHRIQWAAYISGMRESRRLLGDLILNKEDMVEPIWYKDGVVPTGWKIDLHFPHPDYEKGFENDQFISKTTFVPCANPYYIPYRCFYSRNIKNMFMAGRDISVTREALASVRVMKTTSLMGEVVAMAASVCKKNNALPRDVYTTYFDQLKELCGISKLDSIGDFVKVRKAGNHLRFTDNLEYTVSSMPAELKEYDVVTIPRGNYGKPGKRYSFKLNRSSVVYLSVHERGGYVPEGWEQTDLSLVWGEGRKDRIYKRAFEEGEVVIPEHTGELDKNYGVPHMAFVAEGTVE